MNNWKNIINSQNSVRKKGFGGKFTFSNCHIIGLDTGSLVQIVYGQYLCHQGGAVKAAIVARAGADPAAMSRR
jgi:hypothetical protein